MAILETGRLIKQNERKCPRHIIHIYVNCSIMQISLCDIGMIKDIEHFLINEYDKTIRVNKNSIMGGYYEREGC